MADHNQSNFHVRIIKIANALKTKLGRHHSDNAPGYLSEDAIKEADKLIGALCENAPVTILERLNGLSEKWKAMKAMPESPQRQEISKEIFTLAHEIKDITSMCGYDLLAYFAESLRDYIAKTDLNLEAQHVIIQAHMDALNTVHKKELKDEGGKAAEELKQLVKIAIDKFS